jgi:hypothetical protein
MQHPVLLLTHKFHKGIVWVITPPLNQALCLICL